MTELQENKKAPDFKLASNGGKEIGLKDFLGKKHVVVYFYPKDNTPGCTQESCDFRDRVNKFEKLGAVVLGISADSLSSHENFSKKFSLPFPLLSDENKKVIQSYGVWKEKSMYGKKYMGIERTTVLIDKKGMVRKIFPKVKVTGHIEEVLSELEKL